MQVTYLGVHGLFLESVGKNDIFFANTARAPSNHSYYYSLNDFQNLYFEFVLSSWYPCICLAIHHDMVHLDWLPVVIESTILGTPEDGDWVNKDMHLDMIIKQVRKRTKSHRCIGWRHPLGGRNGAYLEMDLELQIKRTGRSTWWVSLKVYGNTHASWNQVFRNTHFEVVNDWLWRYYTIPWLNELRDALWWTDWNSFGTHLEVVM